MASRLLKSRLSPLLRSAILNPHIPIIPPIPRFPPTFPASAPCPLRHLSSAVGRRYPQASGGRPMDIGARARQLQNRRLWTYALTFSCIAGFVVIVLSNFQEQLLFYITPSDALAKFSANLPKTRFRLGGLVMEGSVVHPSGTSPEMEFVVTDLLTDILVRFDGVLPDLFREGHSVVVEGFLRPFSADDDVGPATTRGPPATAKARNLGCYFKATEVLAKHDEKYMPKEVATALEKNKKILEEAEAKALLLEKTS